MRELGDGELLEMALRRESAAWAEVLRRFGGLIRKCAARVVPDEVDDVVGDVCERLLSGDMRRLRLFEPGRGVAFGTWLHRVTQRVALDRLRARRRRDAVFYGDSSAEHVPSPEPSAEELLLRGELSERVSRLGGRYREFYDLRYVDDLEPREVAARMGISEKTYYTKHARMVHALARQSAT